MMRDASPEVAVSSPVWPSVAPGWQGRINSWITRYPEIAFQVGERNMTLSWVAPRPTRLPLTIRLQCAGYDSDVNLSGLEAIDARLVGEPFVTMPGALRNLVVGRLVTECVDALPPALAQGIRLVGVDWHDEPDGDFSRVDECAEMPTLAFEWRNDTTGAVSSGCMRFADAAVLDWVLDRFGSLAVRKLDGRTLATRLSLSLGSATLAPSELGQLETGGFVWIGSSGFDSSGMRASMHFDAGDGLASARVCIKQRRVTVTDSLQLTAAVPGSGLYPLHDNAAGDVGAAHDMESSMKIDLSRLELQLDFGLGDVMLPVGEIEKLGPGYVFELPQEVADCEVLIRVSGKLIAVGEIVAVGRRLGVRITRMEPGVGSVFTPPAATGRRDGDGMSAAER